MVIPRKGFCMFRSIGKKLAFSMGSILLVFLLATVFLHVKLQEIGQTERQLAAGAETQALLHGLEMVDGVMIACCLGAMIMGCYIVFRLSRSLSSSIAVVVQRARKIAVGDLSGEELIPNTRDELAELMASINEMQKELCELLHSFEQRAESMVAASERMSAGSKEGAERANQQNKHTAIVESAIQEMFTVVEEVASNSSSGAVATRTAAEIVGESSAIIEEVMGTMRSIAASVGSTAMKIQELAKSSEQIGRVAAVINEIAEQTNLLALNAAIEAARAGEHGRGFSVVAGEVRRLADRTTKSTQEIAQTIAVVQSETKTAVDHMKADTEKVSRGIETAARLSSSQAGVTDAVRQADDTVMQIAFSAVQQSASVGQIRSSIEEIAQITRDLAGGAQESAQASEQISVLAHGLQQEIARFQLAS